MLHLLLIEDNALASDALRTLFELQGYRVTTAGSVTDGVACAKADHADVMLLDLTLPDGDGLEILAQLQQCDAVPGATVAVTGHDDAVIRNRCLAAGCRTVLLKPVPPRELVALVRSLETARH